MYMLNIISIKLRKQFLHKFVFVKQIKKSKLKYIMYTLFNVSAEILNCVLLKKKHRYKEFKNKNKLNFFINL